MASQPIKRNGHWQVRWRHEDQWQQITEEHEADAARASAFVSGLRNRIADTDEAIRDKHYLYGAVGGWERANIRRTFAVVVEEWLASKIGWVDQDVIKHLRGTMRNHGADWATVPVGAIGSDMLNAKYLTLTTTVSPFTGAPLAYSTVSQIMFRLGEVLAYAKAKGYTSFDMGAARRLRELRYKISAAGSKGTRGALTRAQVEALVDAMPTLRDKLIIRVMVDTGGRIGEVMALLVGDLNAAHGVVTFRARMKGAKRMLGTKGHHGDRGDGEHRHTVAISRDLLADLVEWVKDRPRDQALFPPMPTGAGRQAVGPHILPGTWRDGVFNPVADKLNEAGILPDNVTPHWLRHTTATWLRDLTGNREVVAAHLRHGSMTTTGIYFDATQEQREILRAAMDAAWAA